MYVGTYVRYDTKYEQHITRKIFCGTFHGAKTKKEANTSLPLPNVSILGQDEKWDWGWLPKVAQGCTQLALISQLVPVIGHDIGGKHIPTKWRVSLRPDAGVSDDGLVCHHPTSQPHTHSA
jgi:hypothetical protein